MSVVPIRSEAASRGARMLRTALGPGIALWLDDPAVIEVMLNPEASCGSTGWAKACPIPAIRWQRGVQVVDTIME